MRINNDNITLRSMNKTTEDYQFVYHWCQNIEVYEWFEQRVLSYDEVVEKYRNKIDSMQQEILIIEYKDKPIGLLQFYKFNNDINLSIDGNIYEYDLFIGDDEYLSKSIGVEVLNLIDNYLFNDKQATHIILRPFKRNERAIKCYLKCNYKPIYEYLGKNTLGNDEEYVVLVKENV